jgi:S1-C subfamily serine protease
MDDLNAQQIVLLTLLVSFVTSIATGITTVALLEQAPDPVTQTINRVVEKTVERVVTEPSTDTETVIEREVVTVVVNEEDLTIEAVEKNSRSLMRIYEQVGDLKNFVALGVVVTSDGDIVTDASQISDNGDYVGVYQSGEFPLTKNTASADGSLVSLSAEVEQENSEPINFDPAKFADSSSLKLGQSVISLSGEENNSVATGIINDFKNDPETGNTTRINTSIPPSNIMVGSIIMNLSGEIIGFKLNSNGLEPTSFITSNMVKSFLLEGNLSIEQVEVSSEETENTDTEV